MTWGSGRCSFAQGLGLGTRHRHIHMQEHMRGLGPGTELHGQDFRDLG